MIEKMERFYEREFKRLECALTLNNHCTWITPQELKGNTLQRMLGIAYFAQDLDLDYREIEALYNEYKSRIEAL